MIGKLAFVLLAPLLVSAVKVPYTHSLVKRNSRIQIPRTLMERSPDLIARQVATCGVGQATCTSGGCCVGSCCGDGCCPDGYVCDFVGNTPACCPTGQTCSNTISGCTDPTLVECTGYDFCCPVGEACSLDATGNAQCNGVSIGNGNGDGNTDTVQPLTSSVSTPFTEVAPTRTETDAGFTQINTATFGGGNNNGGFTVTTPTTTSHPTTNPADAKPTTSSDSSSDSSSQNGAGRTGAGAGVAVLAVVVGAMVL